MWFFTINNFKMMTVVMSNVKKYTKVKMLRIKLLNKFLTAKRTKASSLILNLTFYSRQK